MAFDGIVTKAIASELQNVSGARIDKIFQPNKNTVLLGFYLEGCNYLLNICIDAQNYRIHLTTHAKPNPKVAPNFCMVLRKHLLGLHIKNIITNDLERIVIIDFEGFDDVDDIISKRLVVELMGKHCNIILLDEQNIVIDSLRHIYQEDSNRNIVPHVQYKLPTTNKYNFLDCTCFQDFYEKLPKTQKVSELATIISNTFNGISKSFLEASINLLSITGVTSSQLEKLYNYIQEIIFSTDNDNLHFDIINSKKKDYFLTKEDSSTNSFHLNFFLDDFYYAKESAEEFKIYRDSILKMILEQLKKYQKRLFHIDEKLQSCEDMDKYQLYGELITANLYKIKNENQNELTLENYYENNQPITIPLDNRYTPAINAKRFFKKYHKLKNTLEIVTTQKNDTLQELNYIESIIYELENCTSTEDVSEIFAEISENVIFKEKTQKYQKQQKNKVKKSTLTKNKNVSFNPHKYTVNEYTLLVGRNNKENDYLTLKYAKKSDLWFHTQDIHGSHAILQVQSNKQLDDNTLLKCAEIVAYHSKAKNSSNVPVDFCEVRYVKKPNGAKPGFVIYNNYKTLYVHPKI